MYTFLAILYYHIHPINYSIHPIYYPILPIYYSIHPAYYPNQYISSDPPSTFLYILCFPIHPMSAYPSYTFLSILCLPIHPMPSYPSYAFLTSFAFLSTLCLPIQPILIFDDISLIMQTNMFLTLYGLGLGPSKVLVLRFGPKMNTKVAFNTTKTTTTLNCLTSSRHSIRLKLGIQLNQTKLNPNSK